MAILKYKDVLVMCKDKIKEMMAPLRAHEMKKKAEFEIAKLESQIAEKEQKVQELASQYPVEFASLLTALDDLELTKRRKKQFEKIIVEMFS
jgi:hypothetical protein